jgi:hypothetical protein
MPSAWHEKIGSLDISNMVIIAHLGVSVKWKLPEGGCSILTLLAGYEFMRS